MSTCLPVTRKLLPYKGSVSLIRKDVAKLILYSDSSTGCQTDPFLDLEARCDLKANGNLSCIYLHAIPEADQPCFSELNSVLRKWAERMPCNASGQLGTDGRGTEDTEFEER